MTEEMMKYLLGGMGIAIMALWSAWSKSRNTYVEAVQKHAEEKVAHMREYVEILNEVRGELVVSTTERREATKVVRVLLRLLERNRK